MEHIFDYEEQSKKIQQDMLSDAKTLNLVREYCSISSQRRLSEKDADRLAEILTLAESNSRLELWLNEADHFLGHELGLQTDSTVYTLRMKEKKTQLLKHLNFWTQRSKDTKDI